MRTLLGYWQRQHDTSARNIMVVKVVIFMKGIIICREELLFCFEFVFFRGIYYIIGLANNDKWCFEEMIVE